MISIKDLLNEIKWDSRENPSDYVLFYYAWRRKSPASQKSLIFEDDRIENKLKELKLVDVEKVEEGFLVLMRSGKEINIPLHRVRKVEKKGKVVWERV